MLAILLSLNVSPPVGSSPIMKIGLEVARICIEDISSDWTDD